MIQLILLAALTLQTANVLIPGEPVPPIEIWTASVRPCVWPNRCGSGETKMVPVIADLDIEICTLPNKCSGNS